MERKRAVIYNRISDDPEGLALGVQRQDEDNHGLGARLGVQVVRVYTENDRGASTRSKKPRPEYKAMLAAIERGEAEYILAYSNSRITRRPMELEDLIQLHERTGVIIVTCKSGQDDLSTADGRMTARIKASVDAAEAERIGERVAREHLASAMKGLPSGGPRPFGYMPDKIALNPIEAELLRAAVRDVLAGTPIRSIATRWNAMDVKTPFGKSWRAAAVRTVLLSPRIAGYRRYQGKIAVDRAGVPVRAVWEAVVDPLDWERLRVLLLNPSRRPLSRGTRPGAAKFYLTGFLRCARCGQRMYGNPTVRAGAPQPYPAYNCSTAKGCGIGIHRPSADRVVEKLVLQHIEEIKLPKIARAPWSGEIRLAEAREAADALMAQIGMPGGMKAERVIPRVAELDVEIEDLEAQRVVWLAETAVFPGDVDTENIADWDFDHRRALLSRWLEVVWVQQAKHQGGRFDAERLKPRWRIFEQSPEAAPQ